MPSSLLVSVHFHDGRYHGRPDWPPSPARLFQALLAGAARGASLSDSDRRALEWLERLEPPVIAAPAARELSGYVSFVPNNDLDAVARDPARVADIRVGKRIKPRSFDARIPVIYLWALSDGTEVRELAFGVCALAERLCQLGRGVDMAWARGELLDDAEAARRLQSHGGAIHSPSRSGDGVAAPAPQPGSLKSLLDRYAAARQRLKVIPSNHREQHQFTQPPKPRFRQVIYDSPPTRLLFDLVDGRPGVPASAPWRFAGIVALTESVRDNVARNLSNALPDRANQVLRLFVGRGAEDVDKAQRVRIVPLPSIGSKYADRAIRRILVEIPQDCPLREDDIAWAFSGMPLTISSDGEIERELAPAEDRSMLRHFGIGAGDRLARPARRWRTVTPAALPESARRRRIAPERKDEKSERKAGEERDREQRRAAQAAMQALRHAGIGTSVENVRVQREPFEAKGERAEVFAPGTRFAKERLWHVEIEFAEPVCGPLIIGNGRYLGLGLMAPAPERAEGILAYQVIDGLVGEPDPIGLARALRRAVIARVQESFGPRVPIPTFFTGHLENGDPANSGGHEHLAFVYDAALARLLILAPHVIERRDAAAPERRNVTLLGKAMMGFAELRAGAAGKLRLAPVGVDADSDPLFAASCVWESETPYCVARHIKNADAQTTLFADLARECARSQLPRPQVTPIEMRGVEGQGLTARARLTFATAVHGPILIGRSRHFGGGLFVSVDA